MGKKNKHQQPSKKQQAEDLTVNFAGLEYKCADQQEVEDLKLCVSRAENLLRDDALTRAQAETPNFGEGQEAKTLQIENAKYQHYASIATSDPEKVCPIVEQELRSLIKERQRAELGEPENNMHPEHEMSMA